MDTTINKILVPVDLEEHSFSALKHAAALASRNRSVIHMLYVINYRVLGIHIPRWIYLMLPFVRKKSNRKTMLLLDDWKHTIQTQYHISMINVIREGNIPGQVQQYAKQEKVDFIIMGMKEQRNWWDKIKGGTAKNVNRRSGIPVITILHMPEAEFHWQHVVLPVGNFIPEKRIRAILGLAMQHNIKIHFVAISQRTDNQTDGNFDLLLDSLKLVKTFGNIGVECKSIPGNDLNDAAWNYAMHISADAIMGNPGKQPQQGKPDAPVVTKSFETSFAASFYPHL